MSLPVRNVLQPFTGFVATTVDAIRLVLAARWVWSNMLKRSQLAYLAYGRMGLTPRITRRLTDVERKKMVNNGAVFIYATSESGIQRWTDGLGSAVVVYSPGSVN